MATLIAFVAIFSIWVNRQALNTDNWVNTSEQLLQNEEVQTRLSNYLADQLFENVEVQAELEATFPPRLAPLAGPAAGALHQLAPQVAQRALSTPQFESLWSGANRRAHERLLKIVNGGNSTVSTGGGEVTLDLSSLLVPDRRPARRQPCLESPRRRRPVDDPQVRSALRWRRTSST